MHKAVLTLLRRDARPYAAQRHLTAFLCVSLVRTLGAQADHGTGLDGFAVHSYLIDDTLQSFRPLYPYKRRNRIHIITLIISSISFHRHRHRRLPHSRKTLRCPAILRLPGSQHRCLLSFACLPGLNQAGSAMLLEKLCRVSTDL